MNARSRFVLGVPFVCLVLAAPPGEDTTTFKAGTNLVMVPVVVRDSGGNAVPDLRQEDFTLLDNGKPMEIRQFQVETPGQRIAEEKPAPDTATPAAKHAPMVVPDHYVAYVFDDVNFTDFGDLVWVRDGAMRHMAMLQPGDRAAIFTMSCTAALDFTADREALRRTLSKLQFAVPRNLCSDLKEVTPPAGANEPSGWVLTSQPTQEPQPLQSLMLKRIVDRMSTLPGQRSIVLVSHGIAWGASGFRALQETIDAALRRKVVINTLSAYGLHVTTPGADSALTGNAQQLESAMQNQRQAESREGVGLSTLAYGTGGTFVENTNDADAAYRRLATPETVYMLGFSPAEADLDGKLHHLKVTVDRRGVSLQARANYYAATLAQQQNARSEPAALPPATEPPHESVAEAKDVEKQLGIAPLQFAATAPPLVAKADVPAQSQAPTFQSKVNLVMVPVVVRDEKGQAIGTLTSNDFELFDKGARQQITKFVVEKASGQPANVASAPASTEVAVQGEAAKPSAIPDNFVAYLFDDVHIKFGDLASVRDAAGRNIDRLPPAARAAIFTTSGQGSLDFTDDRAKLHAALLKLRARALTGSSVPACPDVSYYMADQIDNKYNILDPADNPPLQAAAYEAMGCLHIDPRDFGSAISQAQAAARRALSEGSQESRVALISLKDVVRRIAAMPGRKNVILVSPGFFFTSDLHYEELDVVERAVQADVIIGSLDARGLYTLNPAGDIDQQISVTGLSASSNEFSGFKISPSSVMTLISQFRQADALAASGILDEMASGTGGAAVRNTNDFDGAFRRLASAPEFVYMLGFAPANLKTDGSYHALKVKLSSGGRFEVQARHGYFAPKPLTEGEVAKEAIDSAVFSREEIHELPVELHTQFFKASETEAKLKVLASMDLKQLSFRKDVDRNRNDVTVVSALFDGNGNFISGWQKIVRFRLSDQSTERIRQAPPIMVTTSFDVKPGSYLIRLVVRDSEGHLMATENGAVEIP